MSESPARVIRAFNNNVVLARVGDAEVVLAGKGIGFGKHPGDLIPSEAIQRQYVEANAERIQTLKALALRHPALAESVANAVEKAAEGIAGVHPSVYVVLVDHLAFAIERYRDGMYVPNELLGEIQAGFPLEFAAAERVLADVSSKIGIDLPIDEAGYIALHLNAARTGASVKRSVAMANLLSKLVTAVAAHLGAEVSRPAIASELARLISRVEAKKFRRNAATEAIRSALPKEYAFAHTIIRKIPGTSVNDAVSGEAAFLAVAMHGWRMDADAQD
ncbi:transcriptional antiterminator [Arcanobacterium wilhelmae]|uniref:Transcriptional antiterminator n=1 Tax=Arcanobacterium wilhelmae TaxID=1803177 RepID=A0ABT9ND49_9ACTO|nr:PRD domain-containing protein [Arcanobacterium wilhelmae]MDP9801653.1 transcriptional antiterminator [Arcanobacterium wilhelmae]WFN90974.1 PRD domain-containing protein [Arcanobacterium wilhelmae]